MTSRWRPNNPASSARPTVRIFLFYFLFVFFYFFWSMAANALARRWPYTRHSVDPTLSAIFHFSRCLPQARAPERYAHAIIPICQFFFWIPFSFLFRTTFVCGCGFLISRLFPLHGACEFYPFVPGSHGLPPRACAAHLFRRPLAGAPHTFAKSILYHLYTT